MFRKTISVVILFASVQLSMGQLTTDDLSGRINLFNTAVPFLTLPMYPAINGMITSVPDGTPGPGIYSNHGLLALDKNRFHYTLNYNPWNRHDVGGVNLFGAGGSYRLNDKHTVGIDFQYFSLGTNLSSSGIQYDPFELAGSLFYTYNLNRLTGLGVGLKYIHSDLICNSCIPGSTSTPGKSIAADLSFARKFIGRNGIVDHILGISLNNVGTKIRYSKNSDRNFIPTTLKVGYGFQLNFSSHQTLSVSYEGSKLLVPTPPVYYSDSIDQNGEPVIEFGYNSKIGVFRGMIQSFFDAPGGIREEWHEITHALGLVYRYRFLSAGMGYYYKSPYKGNQEFFSAGISGDFRTTLAGFSHCRLSVSYLLPINQNPFRPVTFQVGLCLTLD